MLRDWLIVDASVDRKKIEDFYDKFPPMRLCQDICNGLKHYALFPKEKSYSNFWCTGINEKAVYPLL
jgi:hypothetical protein